MKNIGKIVLGKKIARKNVLSHAELLSIIIYLSKYYVLNFQIPLFYFVMWISDSPNMVRSGRKNFRFRKNDPIVNIVW